MQLLLSLIAITWQVASIDAQQQQQQQQRIHRGSRSIETFADRSFKALAEDIRGNFVYSPISLVTILSMISVGADGNTKAQLLTAIEKPYSIVPPRRIEPAEHRSDKRRAFVLRMVSRIFVTEGFTPKPNFSSLMTNVYHSPAVSIDFSRSVQASKTINDWVAAQTNNLVKRLFQPSDLTGDTSLVLVNAVYFKGNWMNPFATDETAARPFHLNGTIVKSVPTMRRLGRYNCGKLSEVKAKFIELPYVRNVKDQSMSMFVILPDEIDGLERLVTNLEKVTIQKLYNGKTRHVELSLPKFNIDTKLDLESSLVKLGVTNMFGPLADFSGISVERKLTVSKIVQKNSISVNELGTEVASATGTQFDSRSNYEAEMTFNVDRPFIVLILNRIGMPYFAAVVVDPSSDY